MSTCFSVGLAIAIGASVLGCSDDTGTLSPHGSRGGGAGGGSAGDGGGGESGSGGADGGGGGGGADSGGGSGGAAQICFEKINAYRATLGLPPYQRWTSAEACSDGEAKSDSQSGQAHGAFGTCGEWAQNECPGWDGPPDQMIPQCLAAMWGEGPGGGHYENMKGSAGYTQAACGFFVKADGSVWSVQNFK